MSVSRNGFINTVKRRANSKNTRVLELVRGIDMGGYCSGVRGKLGDKVR